MIHIVAVLEHEFHALIHKLHLDGHISPEVADGAKAQASTILKAVEPALQEAVAIGAAAAQAAIAASVGSVAGEVLGQVAAGAIEAAGSAVLVHAEAAVAPESAPVVEQVAPDAPKE